LTTTFQQQRRRVGFFFVTPALLLLLLVLAYPILASLVLSFQRVQVAGEGIVRQPVGFANYVQLWRDATFRSALGKSLYFTALEVGATVILSLLLALLLNHPVGRHAFFRVVLLVPWALAPVANAVLWKWIYNANYGVINVTLQSLGVISKPIIWLGSPWLALHMILVADVWKAIPFITLLLLAGLQNIPAQLYRAARLDGASSGQQLRFVTLPGLRTALVIAVVLQSIWALKVFDLIFVLTKGGPADGTVLLNYLAWRTTFSFLDIGYGAAMADVLFVLMLLLALVYIRALRPKTAG
jgi:ABC-type sugar transport system permease subunit